MAVPARHRSDRGARDRGRPARRRPGLAPGRLAGLPGAVPGRLPLGAHPGSDRGPVGTRPTARPTSSSWRSPTASVPTSRAVPTWSARRPGHRARPRSMRTDQPADLELDVAELGSLYLGGVSAIDAGPGRAHPGPIRRGGDPGRPAVRGRAPTLLPHPLLGRAGRGRSGVAGRTGHRPTAAPPAPGQPDQAGHHEHDQRRPEPADAQTELEHTQRPGRRRGRWG